MNEVRLIDANALKEDIVKLCRQINASNGITVPTLAFTRVIDNAPTVDIKDIYQEGHYDGHLEGYTEAINERRPQGEWIHIHTDFTKYHYKCSVCGRQINTHGKLSDYPFCHCGADMRKPNCVTCDHFGKCEGCEAKKNE